MCSTVSEEYVEFNPNSEFVGDLLSPDWDNLTLGYWLKLVPRRSTA